MDKQYEALYMSNAITPRDWSTVLRMTFNIPNPLGKRDADGNLPTRPLPVVMEADFNQLLIERTYYKTLSEDLTRELDYDTDDYIDDGELDEDREDPDQRAPF